MREEKTKDIPGSEADEDANENNDDRQFPLQTALINKQFECAKLLLDRGEKLEMTREGFRALSCAIEDMTIFRMLVADWGLEKVLLWAVKNDSMEVVNKLIYLEADVNHVYSDGNTAIQVAAKNDNLELIFLMLIMGADKDNFMTNCIMRKPWMDELDNKNSYIYQHGEELSKYILHYAIANSKTDLAIKLLNNKQTNLNKKFLNAAPLHFSASKGDLLVTRFLIKNGADLDVQDDKTGLTPIMVSVKKEHDAITKLLIKKGARLDMITKSGADVLDFAIYNNNYDMAKLIMKDKDTISFRTLVFALFKDPKMFRLLMENSGSGIEAEALISNDTLLMQAAKNNRTFVIQQLLLHGANVNHKNSEGKTALHCAVESKQLDSTIFLLRNGADRAITDNHGRKAIDCAHYYSQESFYKYCMSQAIKVVRAVPEVEIHYCWMDELDNEDSVIYGYKAMSEMFLPIAVANSDMNDINHLLKDKKTDVNEIFIGASALHFAAEKGDLMTMKLLVDSGANIDLQDSSGRTPLMVAAKKQNLNAAKLLLDKRANIQLRDQKGATAFSYAIKKSPLGEHQFEIAELLTSLGQRPVIDLSSEEDRSALEIVMWSKNTELFRKLIRNMGSSLNTVYEEDQTLLKRAVQQSKPESVALLIVNGADVNYLPLSGTTALMESARYDNIEMANILIQYGAKASIKDTHGKKAADYIIFDFSGDMTKLLIEEEEHNHCSNCKRGLYELDNARSKNYSNKKEPKYKPLQDLHKKDQKDINFNKNDIKELDNAIADQPYDDFTAGDIDKSEVILENVMLFDFAQDQKKKLDRLDNV